MQYIVQYFQQVIKDRCLSRIEGNTIPLRIMHDGNQSQKDLLKKFFWRL